MHAQLAQHLKNSSFNLKEHDLEFSVFNLLQPVPTNLPAQKKSDKVQIGGITDSILKQSHFTLQIKINSVKELIKGCFKKEAILVGKNMKDAHINTIGLDFLLLSANKNANVISLAT